MAIVTRLARCANHGLAECPTCGTYLVVGPVEPMSRVVVPVLPTGESK